MAAQWHFVQPKARAGRPLGMVKQSNRGSCGGSKHRGQDLPGRQDIPSGADESVFTVPSGGRGRAAAQVMMVPMEIYFDDWRTVDGIQYPFRISQSGGYGSLSFTVKEIRHNVPVNATMFEVPR